MTETLRTLLASKRFLVVTTAVLVLGAFVVAGRMTVDQFVDRFTVLAGLLATLYGVENVAQASRNQGATATLTVDDPGVVGESTVRLRPQDIPPREAP